MRKSKECVDALLEDMRMAIHSGNIKHEETWKTQTTLAKLGYSRQDMYDELFSLTYEDYFSGPDPDRDFPQDDDCWKFKRRVLGLMIYIKFKVRYLYDKSVLIMSFHEDNM